ncbi:MAG TPA: hypothetical protein VNS10_02770 [Gemmatimonadaceae bacterium]|jgi:hypothetical protein|nr:hypothetical protein [Gemmatimonadaceae bacterium]
MRLNHHWVNPVSLLIIVAACSETTSVPTPARPRPDVAIAARSGSPNPRTVPVTSVVGDDPSFQIRSDGLGSYKNSSALQSEIQASTTGDWVLDSYTNNSPRMIYLDFSRPIAGSGVNGGSPVAIPSGYYKFHMISKCHLTGNDFLTILPGHTVQCPLRIGQIFVGTRQYGITMNSGVTSAGEVSWPETNYADVTCNSTAGTCANWTLTPSGTDPNGSPANVAVLIETITSGTHGKTTTTDVKQGDFYLSFKIDITNP